jgi:hypothetical protein
MDFGTNMKTQIAELDDKEKTILFRSVQNGRASFMIIDNFVKHINYEKFIKYLSKEETVQYNESKIVSNSMKLKIVKHVIKEIKTKLGANIVVRKENKEVSDLDADYCLSNFNNKERLQECLIKILDIGLDDFKKDYSEIQNQ